MSSIIGIATNYGPPSIILAADSLTTFDSGHKKIEAKIDVARSWAMASVGIFDKYVARFLTYCRQGLGERNKFVNFLYDTRGKNVVTINLDDRCPLSPAAIQSIADIVGAEASTLQPYELCLQQLALRQKESQTPFDFFLLEALRQAGKHPDGKTDPVLEALRRERFYEIELLTGRARENYASEGKFSDFAEFILACNKAPYFGLYHLKADGSIKKFSEASGLEYLALGSGSDVIKEFFDTEKYNDELDGKRESTRPDRIDTPIAIELAHEAIELACLRDEYTGGYVHVVVLTETQVKDYGPLARQRFIENQKALRKEIKGDWATPSEDSDQKPSD